MAYVSATPAQRTASAAVSAAMVLAIGAAMVLGLRVRIVPPGLATLTAFTVSERPPPPPPPREKPQMNPSSAPKNAPAPRNLKNVATPVFAAPSPLLLPPPPIVVAPAPAVGDAAQTGASDLPGPGQGAGGEGTGTGGGGRGGFGDGSGDGDGDGIATGPRQIRGRLSQRDFSYDMLGPGEKASVGVRYAVEIDGRVSNCRIDSSSGFAEVDTMACRLIEQRFRFRPAKDRKGQPVRATIVERHTWYNQDDD